MIDFSFEKSQTHQFEVPRMLIDEPEQLENYISNGNDKYVVCHLLNL